MSLRIRAMHRATSKVTLSSSLGRVSPPSAMVDRSPLCVFLYRSHTIAAYGEYISRYLTHLPPLSGSIYFRTHAVLHTLSTVSSSPPPCRASFCSFSCKEREGACADKKNGELGRAAQNVIFFISKEFFSFDFLSPSPTLARGGTAFNPTHTLPLLLTSFLYISPIFKK